MAIYYGPVWFVILSTLTLYIAAGIRVFMLGRRSKKAIDLPRISTHSHTSSAPNHPAVEAQAQPEPQSQAEDGNQVTTFSIPEYESQSSTVAPPDSNNGQPPSAESSIGNLESGVVRAPPRFVNPEDRVDAGNAATTSQPPVLSQDVTGTPDLNPKPSISRKNAALSYAEYASFFFLALLVTWVGFVMNPTYGPSTLNHVLPFRC